MTKEKYTDLVLEYAKAVEAVSVKVPGPDFSISRFMSLVRERDALRDQLLKEGPTEKSSSKSGPG